MICPNCQYQLLDEDDSFCPNCGTNLKTLNKMKEYSANISEPTNPYLKQNDFESQNSNTVKHALEKNLMILKYYKSAISELNEAYNLFRYGCEKDPASVTSFLLTHSYSAPKDGTYNNEYYVKFNEGKKAILNAGAHINLAGNIDQIKSNIHVIINVFGSFYSVVEKNTFDIYGRKKICKKLIFIKETINEITAVCSKIENENISIKQHELY